MTIRFKSTGLRVGTRGGTDISGSGQIVNFATVYIDNSVTISDSISLSGGTVALTSGADLTLDDVNASNTAITAGSFVALTDPDVATTIYYGMQAVAIDSAGAVVGTYVDTNYADRSFIYSNGEYTAIDDPDAPLPSSPANLRSARLPPASTMRARLPATITAAMAVRTASSLRTPSRGIPT